MSKEIVARGNRYFIFSSALNLLFYVALLLVLFLRTAKVVSWVVPPSPGDAELHLSAEDLALVTLMLAGFVFFTDGVEALLQNAAAWLFAPQDPDTGSRPLIHFDAAVFLGGVFKSLFGLWLVLGRRGLLSGVKALRGLRGMPSPTEHEDAGATQPRAR